ncbi:MAG TPA: hypothetical protein VIK01_15275, partial [Polyangiaceae bacterium]
HAVSSLHKLIADGYDGYAVEMLLAQTLGSNDEAGAKAALESATGFDPSQAAPHYALADLGEKNGDLPGEMHALRALCALEQHEPKVYERLLRRLNEAGAFDEAVTVGEAAIYADVEGLRTHTEFAEALLNTKHRDRSIFELESAVLCQGPPDELAEAHARLAELYLETGKRRAAKEQTEAARALDPKNARLSKLPH